MTKKSKTKKDQRLRSLVKAVTWRVVATSTTMVIVYLMTGSMELGLGAGFFDLILKIGFYYAHERAWERVEFGK